MIKTLKVNIDQLGDYCSFKLKNKESYIHIDKIWIEPITEEKFDWTIPMKYALIHLLFKNSNANAEKETVLANKSSFITLKLDPFQKDSLIIINKKIETSSANVLDESFQFFDILDISLVSRRGIAPFNMFLDISFEESQVNLIQTNVETYNQKQIRAQARQIEAPLDDHHLMIWLSKNLKSNDISENDIQIDVLKELKETPIYQRIFNS